MTKLRSFVLLVLCLAVFVSCGGDVAGPGGGVEGTYTLQSVDGRPLPAPFYETPCCSTDAVSSTIVLRKDRTYTIHLTMRINGLTPDPYQQSESENGVWELSQSTITLIASSTHRDVGVINGGQITFNLNGYIWLFRR